MSDLPTPGWHPTTDDDFIPVKAADEVRRSMAEYGAGEATISGYASDDPDHDDPPIFSITVAQGPNDVVAVHVDWQAGTVTTAWWVEAEETSDDTPVCNCPRFRDTGGYRIADLTCPVHGVNGTEPGDGPWDDEGVE